MFKNKFIWYILFYGCLVIGITAIQPPQKLWKDSYERQDKTPLGSKIFFETSYQLYDKEMLVLDRPFWEYKNKDFPDKSAFIILDAFPDMSQLEVNTLLDWANEGHIIFFSGKDIPNILLDTLKINCYLAPLINVKNDSLWVKQHESANVYVYPKINSIRAFYVDSIPTRRLLSINETENILCLGVNVGEGSFILSTMPQIFGNAYVLHEENIELTAYLASLIPKDYQVYWNSYYKPTSSQSTRAILSVFLSSPGFWWAFTLGMLLLLAYMLFALKRKQRIIPVWEPPKNSGVEWVQTIGDLYFEAQNSKDLVEKMERYFREYIREKYRMYNMHFTESEIERLSAKSGVAKNHINKIGRLFKKGQHANSISTNEIISLRKSLQAFYYKYKKN